MKPLNLIDTYIEKHTQFKSQLITLRSIINSTELEENFKWNAPVYTINDKNVLGLGAFKNHYCIWFFNGVLLADKHKRLTNAQKGKTKALRQMRFTIESKLDKPLILEYINEAIANQKAGKVIATYRKPKPVEIPELLTQVFNENKNIEAAFNLLTPYKQREYAEYIASAKRDATKLSRLEKIKPMVLEGVGLYDKYKNC